MTTRIRHASATYEALVVALAGRLLAHRGLGRALAGDCLRGSVQETWARTAPQRGLLARGQGREDRRRGFSSLVERVLDLQEVLEGARVPEPHATPSSGVFVRAKQPSRRVV